MPRQYIIIFKLMGNKQPQNVQLQPPTPSQIQKSCIFFATHQNITFTKAEVLQPIKILLQSLRQSEPIKKVEGILQINSSFLKLFFCPTFSRQLMKLVQLLVLELEQLNKKSLTFLKTQQIIELSSISEFILYFSNQKVLQVFDTLLVRSDIKDQSKNLLKQLAKLQDGQLQINGNIVQKMNIEQQQIIQKSLRVTIMNFINLRMQPLGRSENTLRYFAYFQQSLFMLYTKIYFALHNGNKQPNLNLLNQHLKSNLTMGAYFLSSGTSYIQPSLYEAAVVFLYSFLKIQGIEYKQVKSLPSHLFKNLPIIATHSIYEYILTNLLFSLKYIKQGKQVFIRFAFNRIISLKLAQALIKKTKVCTKTLTYYLEQLCLQVKIGQIERACISQVVQVYANLHKENPECKNSQIFPKFMETSKIKYNLKFVDKNIKITREELLTELEDNDDTCIKQYYAISHKFVQERILFKALNYNFNDKLLWQEILPNLMNSKQDDDVRMSKNKGGQDSDSDSSKEQNRVPVLGTESQEKREHISVLQPEEEKHAEHIQ